MSPVAYTLPYPSRLASVVGSAPEPSQVLVLPTNGWGESLEERFVNIADGGGVALPDELHDFQFLGGERGVLGAHDVSVL